MADITIRVSFRNGRIYVLLGQDLAGHPAAVVTTSLKRRCTCRNAVAWATSGEHVGDEEAEGSRLLIGVGAYCASVAVLRNHAEIVLTHHNRETP
jgi:hypothetical protein